MIKKLTRFKTAFIITFFISVLGCLFAVLFYYVGGFTIEFKYPKTVIIISFLIFFLLCLALVQYHIERYIFSKVKALYDEFYNQGATLKSKSLEKDAQSLTLSIEEFAKKSRLEIQLLKEKANYRKEFIGNVAHELKTPLFTVESYVLTLLDGAIEDKKVSKKYLKKAVQGIDRLNHIVSDLDLITKIESGVTTIKFDRFDLYVLIEEVLGLMEIPAQEKNINLLFDKTIKKELWVFADRKRISQVITNLIINSLKYGVQDGTTEVLVELLNKQKLLVRIIDNGKGIKAKHIPRLFERFYRVDKARNRDEGGSGLGLAIVKHLIEAHHEKIYVESTYDVGSEFSFSLSKAK